MRSLYAVPANSLIYVRRVLASIMLLCFASVSLTATAEWKDPLNTPAMDTLLAHNSLLLDIHLAGERLVAVGERGHIIYSDDNGYTWKQAQVPVITTLTAVYFVDNNTGWAVGHDAVVLHSNDAGQTWSKQFDGFVANQKVYEQAKETKEALQDELNKANVMGNMERIEDVEERLERATWAMEDALYDLESESTKPLLDVWFKNQNEGFIIGAYGMVFKTQDGGKTWRDWSTNMENPNRFHYNAIVSVDDNRLMIAGEAGMLLRSENGGQTFEQTFSPYDGSFFGIINLKSQNVQLAFGLRGNLARTDTFGSRWKLMNTGTEQSLIGGTDRMGRVAYVVGNGGSFTKGIDLGRKWESYIREGRHGAASIVEAPAGHFVIVGDNGVELLEKTGERIDATITSVEG
ncbi:photosystem I reaction center subunit IV [Bermanella marisrubri]|nr:YCF48-related protein [Bermanella marisrubri]QIZ83856.1 photosystem I reaction center subunit IV [Bermanella marisrubri]